MKYKKILPLFLVGTLLLSACGNGNGSEENNSNADKDNESLGGTRVEVDFSQTDEDMFSNRDSSTEYKFDPISIQLNGTSASCDSDTSSVKIEGTTITISDEGTYVFSGSLDNGMILVDAEDSDKPQLVFDGVTITGENSAPLYILEADKVFVTLAEGSTNTLSNGGTFIAIDENNIDGTIYSKQDLTFNGNGSLTVESPGGHGIVAKDDLVFTSGIYSITSSGHGIEANDSLRVKDASLTIAAGKDGVHVENNDDIEKGFIYISSGTFDITAEGDGFSAGSYLQVNDGSFDILAGGGYENGEKTSSDNWGDFGGGMGMPGGGMGGPGGGRRGGVESDTNENSTSTGTSGISNSVDSTSDESTSMKGLKAGNSLLIDNGTFNIDSADDSIHSDISVYINGGTYSIASGDDGIHGEEELVITNGTIDITQSYEGLEALDITFGGGSVSIQSTDDGINAAGGTDASGTEGGRDGMYGDGMGMPGGHGGMSANSNGSITITGGSIFMYAQGDGLDANGTIEITGGKTIVTGPTQGDTAILDYDTTATINGGTFIGVGSTMMAQTFSDGTQGTFAVQGSGAGGTAILLQDTEGNEIISFTPETAYQCIIISTPDIVKGESYTIYVGNQSGTFEAQ
ncbi:MAG: carbohydrate-binding domain-containing protein [Agathobacter sp.]|nr:carbohydrate-binding domain-containing protein [Agathobacter sp.]